MEIYDGIALYLEHLTTTLGLDITINDFAGFLRIDKRLLKRLQPYLIHKNPYCMLVKSNRRMWDRCLSIKRNIVIQCEKRRQPFWGMCYGGVEEYIVPIVSAETVIGFLCAGEFVRHKKAAHFRITKVAKRYGMDAAELENVYDTSVSETPIDERLLRSSLCIVSDYFSALYANYKAAGESLSISKAKKHSSEEYILCHVLEYIHTNFRQNIMVSDIAAFCHCSESYINHIFRKNMKFTLKTYVNRQRVEYAKGLLIHSGKNIVEIAYEVGFNDSNYFSRVFAENCGITATEYRRRYAAS